MVEIKEDSKGFEKIFSNGELLAIIIRDGFDSEGLSFFTEEKHGFQVGFHNVPKGKRYKAHVCLPFGLLEGLNPNKIYYMKKGKAGVDFYSDSGEKLGYSVLENGDMILFISGGHGVDILEDAHMIEVKQGPYRGVEDDKKFLEE